MAKKSKTDVNIESQAISIMQREINSWSDATCFVTEKVAFQMRNLIRQLRKNYWGIFDQPTDPITGRKKIWIPLTESTCETVIKNIDLDTKDINFRSEEPQMMKFTPLVRTKVRDKLNDMFFGEYLDEMERQIAIDGTAVWKTTPCKEKGKKDFKLYNVDLLNFYIDPTARSIQEAEAVIERSVMSVQELKSYNGWINTEDVPGDNTVSRTDADFNTTSANSAGGEVKMVEVWER